MLVLVLLVLVLLVLVLLVLLALLVLVVLVPIRLFWQLPLLRVAGVVELPALAESQCRLAKQFPHYGPWSAPPVPPEPAWQHRRCPRCGLPVVAQPVQTPS
mmetsp:Transcript_20838/g.79876  ORF Transcript_20838/g.79876 Transcript_20838/m.79876 type:complete len:101 (-) Transcript_20838:1395-1697(-)